VRGIRGNFPDRDFGYSGFMKRRISATKAPARSRLNSEQTIRELITEAPIASTLAMNRSTKWTVLASTTEIKKRKRPRPFESRDALGTALPRSLFTSKLKACALPVNGSDRLLWKIRAKSGHSSRSSGALLQSNCKLLLTNCFAVQRSGCFPSSVTTVTMYHVPTAAYAK
jgi:hypothetical protein